MYIQDVQKDWDHTYSMYCWGQIDKKIHINLYSKVLSNVTDTLYMVFMISLASRELILC